MRDPRLFEKVQLKGRDGLFLVTRIDPIFRIVNLLPLDHGVNVEENISFDSLELLATEPESSMLREKLDERQERAAKPD